MTKSYDAVVIGSGPNGLSAAILLAKAGLSTIIYEMGSSPGGGMRSAELTVPGFVHDICSAIHPLAISSPFFKQLPLDEFGLEWINPPSCLAHPFDNKNAVLLNPSLESTAENLGIDGGRYKNLIAPFVKKWEKFGNEILAPFHLPVHPFLLGRFANLAFRSAFRLWEKNFKTIEAQSLFAGLAGHSLMPLDQPLTAAFGLMLAICGHVAGWPFPKGGAQKIADALVAFFQSIGGEIELNRPVQNLQEFLECKIVMCDVSPKELLRIGGSLFPEKYQKKLLNFRYGPGSFKVDWALSQPIPWSDERCNLAGCLHLGGTSSEILSAEREVSEGKHPEKPFVILAQQTLFDAARAPEGKHTAWGYCHVPNGSSVDMTKAIEDQIERFAPGFRECILARSVKTAMDLEGYNPNYVGGDINGGVQDISQLFSRPAYLFHPYSTPVKNVFICSSSTPPGGGVHGMCGYHAAKAALKNL